VPKIRILDYRLEYEWIGPKPNLDPTIVFLHEGLGSVATWKDFPERIADESGLGVLVYSRPGYGKSDSVSLPRPASFMHDEALIVLPAILDAFNIQNYILFGHSDGASIALIYAGSDRAKGLKGVVSEAAHVFVEDLTIKGIVDARDAYENGSLKSQLERYYGANVESTFRGWNDVWLRPEFLAWNIESFLPHIQVPVLVIQGENDEYGTLDQVEAIRKGCRGRVETLVLPACGHDPHREQPDLVTQATNSFINSLRI